jgi:biotin operon repressor
VAITLLTKWKMQQAIIQHPAVKSSGVEVAARLLDHLNTKSLRCDPSYATIAEATGLSRDTVMSSVQDLESAGFLKVNRSVELGERAAKGQRLPSNSFEFDFSKVARSEKPTTPRRKSRPPQSEKPTTPVENSDHPQSENTGQGSRKLPPKAGNLEAGNLETGKGSHPAVAGQLALLNETVCDVPDQKDKKGNGKRRTRKTKTDLPDDWVLSDDQWNFGAKLGLTGDQIEAAQRKLKRWVKREGKRYADWNSFTEDWLERELAFLRNTGRGGATDDKTGFSDFANGVDRG